MSQGNKKITTRKIPATNNVGRQFALFQEIPVTNYKILVRTGTGTRDSSFVYANFLPGSIEKIVNQIVNCK